MQTSNLQQLQETSASSPKKRKNNNQSIVQFSHSPKIIPESQKTNKVIQQKSQPNLKIIFSPTLWEKVLMLPLPFFCYGCFTFLMNQIQINQQLKQLNLTNYPGYLACLSKTYTFSFSDILGSKVEMVHNHRINRRQTYKLVLQTKSGEFELTSPKIRAEILNQKNNLDQLLRNHDISTGDPWLMVP